MGFEQYGGYLKLGYDFARNWKVWGDLNLTHFNSSNPGSVDEPYIDNDQRITRGMAAVAVENEYDRTSGSVSFFCSWGDHWINDGYRPGGTPLDYRFNSEDRMYGVSLYQSARLFKGNRLTLGFDWFHFGGESWNEHVLDSSVEMLADKALDEIAGYVDFRQDFGSWLTLDAGVRVDYHQVTGTEVIPQAGLAFHLPGNAELKAMASKGFRNPTIREMYMFPPQNPDLQPERLWSYELSANQTLLNGRLHYGVSVFYINGDNLIMRLPNPSGSGMLNQNSGKIENWGVEADLSYRFKPVMDGVRELQLAPHGESGACFSAAQALCRSGFHPRPLERFYPGCSMSMASIPTSPRGPRRISCCGTCSVHSGCWTGFSVYVKGENLLAQRYEILAGYPMPKATFTGGLSINI